MIIRGLDVNHDWVYGKGKSDYRKNLSALDLDLDTRLNSWKYDCFFAEDEGVDYKNFLDRGTKVFLDNSIKRIILQTEGVLRISSFESTINEDTRNYTFTSSVFTIFGNLEVDFVQNQ